MEKEEEKEDIKMILLISIVFYLLYLELNPKLTGIWLRIGSNNRYYLNLKGLINFFLYPFREKKVWNPLMWDLNPYISISLLTIGLYIIKKYLIDIS